MTAETSPDRALDRRHLIRGGAVLAGTAGIAAVGAAMAPSAQAANGAPVTLGTSNDATTTTAITANSTAPALSLTNTGGPTLQLNALGSFNGVLKLGEIVNTVDGPLIGVKVAGVAEKTTLTTGFDLDAHPAPIAFTPERLIDTRVADDRASIVGSSGSPFDAKGQLKGGAYIDIAIAPIEVGPISAVFLNLSAVKPSTQGFLAAYPSGFPVPATSNVNFQPNVTIANAAFIAVGQVGDDYAIRVYVAKASHVIVDLTGVVLGGDAATPEGVAPRTSPTSRQAQQARRVKRMRSAVTRSAGR